MNGVSSSFSSSSKNLDEAEFPIEYMGTEFQGTDENSVPNSNSVPVPRFFPQLQYQELELELSQNWNWNSTSQILGLEFII